MKKFRLFLLTALLTLSMTVLADTYTDSSGRTFTYAPSATPAYATLSGFTGTDLVVPAKVTINGKEFTVANITTFTNNTKLTSVTFESGMKGTAGGSTYGYLIPANCFKGCSSLKTVDLGDNTIEIGQSAFDGVTSLTTVENGRGVSRIGDYAFRNCTKLSTFAQGGVNSNGTWYIGSYAFQNCTSLTSWIFPWTVKSVNDTYIFEGAFMNSGIKTFTCPPSLGMLPKKCFYGCKNLANLIFINMSQEEVGGENVKVSYNLSYIADSCFMNCPQLEYNSCSVWRGDNGSWVVGSGAKNNNALRDCATNLAYIGVDAFRNCGFSSTVAFPYSLSAIDDRAYYSCKRLPGISFKGYDSETSSWIFNKKLTKIGKSAFEYCDTLKSIDLIGCSKLSSIGESAFRYCVSLTSANFSSSNGKNSTSSSSTYAPVTKIADWCFSNCTSLTTIKFNGQTTEIGKYAFQGCTALTSVTIPETITSIGESAFANCSALATLIINTNSLLETINASAFSYCTALKTTYLNRATSLKTIGNGAFQNCTSLTDNFKQLSSTKLETVGSSAFYNCTGITYVDFPSTIKSIGGGGVFGNDLALIGISIPSGGNSYYTAKYGSPLISTDGKFLCYPAKHLTNYSLPSADFVDGYLVPANVNLIDDYAFQGVSNEHIVLPDAVTKIGSYAFDQCANMTELTIPASCTSIGYYAFNGCTKLASIYCLRTALPTLVGAPNAIGSTTKSTTTLYVKPTALSTYTGSTAWTNVFKAITDEIPYKSTYEYQSRCFDFDVDLSSSTGLTAYTVTKYADGKATLTAISSKYIPSRISNGNTQASYTGVIIKGTKGASTIVKIGTKATATSTLTNLLVGCPGTHWMTATYSGNYSAVPSRFYALKDGKFCRYNAAGRIPYNRAYLDGAAAGIPSGYGADVEAIFFDEDGNDVTAIEQLEAGVTEEKDNGAYYNLNGVKVENPSKGIYIHNGKKVVIK